MNTLWKIAILLLMMITMMSIIFSVHLLLRRKQGMITICLLFFDDYGDENNFVEFAPTAISKNDYVYVGVLILLCMWLMIRMFYVIVILLIIFMMLLKVIMREGNMV
jgi:hypothetical protein